MRTSGESNPGLSIVMDFPRQVHVPDAMDNRIAVLSFLCKRTLPMQGGHVYKSPIASST